MQSYSELSNESWYEDDLNYVQEGFEDNWSEDRDDPAKLGVLMREAGIAEKDPYKLRLAASNFRRIKQTQEAIECDAIRLEIEAELTAAGKKYLELGEKDKALKLFWRDRNYSEILRRRTAFANTIEHRAADFMHGTKSAASCEKFLDFLVDEMGKPGKAKIIIDGVWSKVFNELMRTLVQLDLKAINNWKKLFNQLKFLKGEGLQVDYVGDYAMIAYRAEDYDQAVKSWDKVDNTRLQNDKNYQFAKSQTTEFPEKLKWLTKIGNHQQVVEYWERNRRKLSQDYVNDVLDSFLHLKRYKDALTFIRKQTEGGRLPHENELKRAYQAVVKAKQNDLVADYASLYIDVLLKKGKWREAIALTRDRDLKEKTRQQIDIVLVKKFAVSDELTTENQDVKVKVGDYLNQAFIKAPWNDMVDFRVVGTAIERAEKITDGFVTRQKGVGQ